jgi:hypothetical protein
MDAKTSRFSSMEREYAEEEGNTAVKDEDCVESAVARMMRSESNADAVARMMRSDSNADAVARMMRSDSNAGDLGLTEAEHDDLMRSLQDDVIQVMDPPSESVIPSTAAKPRPIPVPKGQLKQSGMQSQSQASSQGSSGSAFLSSVLNPTASTFNNTQLSHTPPTFGTSYEASHFGKRARSGSISGRLRSASEYLEERGLLDRHTKGILNDLIIIGDEELQQAIDYYESGDPSRLEQMINTGELQNRLPSDLDILGDLDLDFLTMNDPITGDMVGSGGGNIESLRNSSDNEAGSAASLPDAMRSMTRPNSIPSSVPTFEGQRKFAAMGNQHQPNMVSPPYNDDGIGDLEFAGDLVTDLQLQPQTYGQTASESTSPAEATGLSDFERRMRSNSLFSALLNDPHAQPDRMVSSTSTPALLNDSQYGKWMQSTQTNQEAKPKVNRRASTPSIPSGITASLEAEQKKLEKLAKKEKREKVKQDKKEKKEREKKEAMEEEIEEHIPGSGRPRSLSDPNLRASLDQDGLQQVERPDGWVGAYSPESRKVRIDRFMEKRNHRVWTKTVKYDVRKNFADSRLRVKGRFVKKEDEVLMRELMSLT